MMRTAGELRALLTGVPDDFYLWEDRTPRYSIEHLEVMLYDGSRYIVRRDVFGDGCLDAAGGREHWIEYLTEDGTVIPKDKIRAYKQARRMPEEKE